MDFDTRAKALRSQFIAAAEEEFFGSEEDELTPLIAATLQEGYVVGQKEFPDKARTTQHAREALKEVFDRRAEIDGAVNWGDLSIVEVGWYNDRWLVFVEEVAPDAYKFQVALQDAIETRIHDKVEVRTSW